jgi:hypothetical protein
MSCGEVVFMLFLMSIKSASIKCPSAGDLIRSRVASVALGSAGGPPALSAGPALTFPLRTFLH